MAEKVRIYQLAKELDLESKEMLAILDEMGVEYKSHSSSLDEETAAAVRQLAAEGSNGDGADSEPEAVAEAEPASEDAPADEAAEAEPANADAPLRAPVVTVMGHVDHGKTSLLDTIRKTAVADREAGGITQHIGAYQAETEHGLITFLDTPGHEAFTSIRQRGANATDIAIIVVAADDSIMPQTREAIAHARAAEVPIIVAINKIDLPQANPEKVKQDLMQVELIPEAFGGDTIVVEISAMTGQGVPDLLEMISLVAEVEDLRATDDGPAKGVVIESILDKRAGVLATVLVQEGQLRVGDSILSGEAWARVRRLTDYAGKQLDVAGPSVPVQVLGFSDQPGAGDTVEAVGSDAEARDLASDRADAREVADREDIGRKGITLADLYGKPNNKTINLLLRADTQGSLEAIKGVLERESEATEEVDIEIMQALVGSPTESDLLLASTAEASVMSFGVNAPGSVKKAAQRLGVPLKSYKIIYNLIEDVQRMVRGQIEPEYEEQVIGHAEVRQIIRVPRSGNIAGSYVTNGTIRRGAKARLTRDGKEVYKGSIAQLRRFKDDVREVSQGFECGINLQNYDNAQEGDVIEAYEMVEVPVA
jgi:translation initiation factor IF-2